MTTAERIVIGIASVIALIGWLRWVGEAGSQDVGLRNQHPTGPPKYQRPSNEPSEANGQKDNDIANLTPELPTTLAADESSGGVPVKMVFERHIVYPNGHREIEGVTPKQLPAPASHVLPGSDRPVSNSDDVSGDKSDT